MNQKVPHIMVDAFPLVDDHFSGVGHATLGIVQSFDEMAGEGKITYSLITPRRWTKRLEKYNFQNYKKVIANPIPNRIIRGFMKYRWRVPLDLFLGRGYYYFPSFLAWPLWFNKSSVVIHDVTYLAVPECVEVANRKYLEQVAPFSIKNARNIVTVSEFSKKEILKYYKEVQPENVHVALNSIDRTHFYKRSEKEIKSVKLKYDIYEESYILCVGNIEPRKNYEKLVEAYTQLPRGITNKYPLVIVGAGGWNNKEILNKIQEAKEAGYKIIHPKAFVPDSDMPALYSGAKLYVFAPIYEGFGMSPLEAFACGTPAVVSNISPVHEAAGKAAVYFNPNSSKDIAQKIQTTLTKLEKTPDEYRENIKEHLRKLSWRPSAEITAAALTGLSISYFRKGNQK